MVERVRAAELTIVCVLFDHERKPVNRTVGIAIIYCIRENYEIYIQSFKITFRMN